MQTRLGRLCIVAYFVVCIWITHGCSVSNNPPAASSTTGTTATPAATAAPTPASGNSTFSSAVTTFQVVTNTSPDYTILISKNGDGTTPCTVLPTDADKDVLCIVDMLEQDVYNRGYTLTDSMPASMCAYRRFFPYLYNIAPWGNPPTDVYYALDVNSKLTAGNAPHTISGCAAAATGPDIYYCIASTDPNNPGASWQSHATIYGGAAKAPGDLTCPFDYSVANRGGNNCCSGNYNLVVDTTTGSTTTPTPWGGKLSNCFEGPAFDIPGATFDDTTGLPKILYTSINQSQGGGLVTSMTVAAPITRSDKLQRMIYASNWFAPNLNGNGAPFPSLAYGLFASGTDYLPTSVYNDYECFDHALELQARIRVLTRRWTTASEFKKFQNGLPVLAQVTNVVDANHANPDLQGSEAGLPPNDPGNPQLPTGNLNDWCGWDDWSAVGGRCHGPKLYTSFGFTGNANPDQNFGIRDNGLFATWYYVGFSSH